MSKFEKTHCSQCGGEFGPGDSGYSHCSDHWSPGVRKAMSAFEAGLAKRWTEEFGLPWHIAPWGDGSRPSVVNICSESHAAVVAADLERDVANWIVNTANAASAKPEGLLAGGEQVLAQASHPTPPAEEDRGEILPCPFDGASGEEVALYHEVFDARLLWFVRCHCCCVETQRYDSEEQATAAWNRRALLSSPRVEGETRRKVLEEAAKVADAYLESARSLLVNEARYGATSAAIGIAGKIRSLSLRGE